ncbi:sensor histidine kinase [Arcicella rigui]|uniref:Two-component regulator propeller domain-containing protein n=1 Tax=Arcicella rigui TaxID=797020 RepID=A0ABU5QA43_9BACT|nr:two-component regulator propeller domain-containing protein [Arcicella rigui]MEA5139709.1 two-component regulator propeller domain-containing protein [Arcicella rigui]
MKKILRLLGYLACISLCTLSMFKAYGQLSQENFEIISTKTGLPSNQIYHLAKDKKGFLWLATAKGLFRYDGYRFVRLGPKAFAEKISIEDDKHLVVSFFSTGIFRINTETHDFQAIATPKWQDDNPDNDHFNNVFVDAQKRIWSADFHHAKYFDAQKKRWHLFPLFKNTAEDVTSIRYFMDSKQKLWILALNRLYYFDEQKNEPILFWQFPKNIILRTLSEHEQHFWLGTLQGKIIKFSPETKSVQAYSVALNEQKINEILWVGNKAWIASDGGLYIFDEQKKAFENVRGFENIKPNFTSFLFDKQGKKIWISSDAGLLKYENGQSNCETILIPPDLVQLPVTVTSFLPINQDESYLGLSHSGMLKWNSKTGIYKKYTLPEEVYVNKMMMSQTGDVLLATSKGVFQLSKNSNTLKKILPAITRNITSFCFDQAQRLWLVSEYRPIQVFDYPSLQEVHLWEKNQTQEFWAKSLINDIALAPDGKIWLASWYSPGFGICYFNQEKHSFIQVADLQKNKNRHNQFIGDYFLGLNIHQNRLFASGYGGFNVLDKSGTILSKFEINREKEDFPNDYFAKIAVDKQGFIWVGTSDGLLRFSADAKQFAKFIEEDGLMSNNTSNGFWLNDHNQLWIGQKNGFNILKINDISLNKVPDLSLSTFEILGGKSVPYQGEQIDLQRNENNLSFTFSPLNFSPIAKNQYRYRLVGINKDWVYNGSNNTLVLIDLPPNTYQLEVAIGTNHGVWSSKPFKMSFNIQPSFVETIWFKILILTLVALIIYTFYRYRINQLLKIEQLRTEISADLHDDVGATLSSISILSTLVQHQVQDSPTAQKYLNTILEDTSSLQNKLEEIIWSLRSDRDTVGQLTARIRRIGSEIFEAKGINYEFEVDDSIAHLKLSMDFRRNLLLIAKEAVNNLVKYSDCKNAKISIQKVKGNLELVIKDDGKGFEDSNIEGNGLRNMRARADKMKGKLTVYSILGQGTEVKLVVALTQIGD